MRVFIGSDHAGFELKNRLLDHVRSLGHEPVDCGPEAYDADDDYPAYCLLVGARTVANAGTLGIVIGGSGNGEAIAANKIKGVRCALAFSDDTAKLGKEHNDANVLSLGARMYDEGTALRFATLFLETPFSGVDRHQRRINILADYESTGELPSRPDGGDSSLRPG